MWKTESGKLLKRLRNRSVRYKTDDINRDDITIPPTEFFGRRFHFPYSESAILVSSVDYDSRIAGG